MCTKWRYNICICSVILGQLESFRNYKGLSIIFQEKFRYNFKVYERSAKIIFLTLNSLRGIFEPENYRFPFFAKLA